MADSDKNVMLGSTDPKKMSGVNVLRSWKAPQPPPTHLKTSKNPKTHSRIPLHKTDPKTNFYHFFPTLISKP